MKIAIQENMVKGSTFKEKISRIENYGFDAVELMGGGINDRIDEIKSAIKNSKVKVSTICTGQRGSILSDSKEEREMAFSDLKNLLTACAKLNAIGFVFVPIFGSPKFPDLSPFKTAFELEREFFINILGEIGDYAKKVGSYVLLEPLNRYETHFMNRLEQAVEYCKIIKNDYIKVMGDFFHMSIEESDMPKSILEAEGYLEHMHLADSNRILPGQGHTDFASSFKALKSIKFDKYMALECGIKGDPEIEIQKCIKFLRNSM